MDALLEQLDTKLREWKLETAQDVRRRVAEIVDAADHDVLDMTRPGKSSKQCWTS